jgi:acetolactate synthase regulatory subunit
LPEELKEGSTVRSAIQRAHLIVTTRDSKSEVSEVAERLGKQVMVVDIRPAFVEKEWKHLFRSGRAYIVVADPRFLDVARSYLEKVMDLRNVRMLIVDRDDMTTIPPHAPTYVTEAARLKLGKFRIPGRLIPPSRLLAENSVRALVAFIVKMNLEQAKT